MREFIFSFEQIELIKEHTAELFREVDARCDWATRADRQDAKIDALIAVVTEQQEAECILNLSSVRFVHLRRARGTRLRATA